MKRWTLREMVRTDIFRRGVPWMLLIKRSGTVETDLNVKAAQKACVALTGLALASAACAVAAPNAALAAGLGLTAAAGIAAIVAINREFFAFLKRRRGWRFACAGLPLHLVYYCCCGLSVVIAMAYWQLSRIRTAPARPDRAAVPPPHLASERRPAPSTSTDRSRR